MSRTTRIKQIIAALIVTFLTSLAVAQDSNQVRTGKQSALLTVKAEVQSINHETREVTLIGPLGAVVSFVADTRVQRLNEIAVGDLVVAEYYVSIAGELRAPTELERQQPLIVIEGGGITPEGTTPAGGVLRAFQVVATVIGLDLPTQSVNLMGPNGNTGSIVAQNLDNLLALSLGDTIILTYTEGLAISLEKAE